MTGHRAVLKTRNSGEWYLLHGREKYGKTIVTFKKPQAENETTQVTINSNLLSYFTNEFREPHKRQKIPATRKPHLADCLAN